MVTEWAEYGNLREFYTNHKDKFDLELKLRIALDIARGLNFLRTVEVNIVISSNFFNDFILFFKLLIALFRLYIEMLERKMY